MLLTCQSNATCYIRSSLIVMSETPITYSRNEEPQHFLRRKSKNIKIGISEHDDDDNLQ